MQCANLLLLSKLIFHLFLQLWLYRHQNITNHLQINAPKQHNDLHQQTYPYELQLQLVRNFQYPCLIHVIYIVAYHVVFFFHHLIFFLLLSQLIFFLLFVYQFLLRINQKLICRFLFLIISYLQVEHYLLLVFLFIPIHDLH
jgi:hypothetical protein